MVCFICACFPAARGKARVRHVPSATVERTSRYVGALQRRSEGCIVAPHDERAAGETFLSAEHLSLSFFVFKFKFVTTVFFGERSTWCLHTERTHACITDGSRKYDAVLTYSRIIPTPFALDPLLCTAPFPHRTAISPREFSTLTWCKIEQFKNLEQSHVEAIIADSPVVHVSREVSEGTAEPAPPEVLYRRGRTSTVCTFVLTGKVVVRAGKDGESEFWGMREKATEGEGGGKGGGVDRKVGSFESVGGSLSTV